MHLNSLMCGSTFPSLSSFTFSHPPFPPLSFIHSQSILSTLRDKREGFARSAVWGGTAIGGGAAELGASGALNPMGLQGFDRGAYDEYIAHLTSLESKHAGAKRHQKHQGRDGPSSKSDTNADDYENEDENGENGGADRGQAGENTVIPLFDDGVWDSAWNSVVDVDGSGSLSEYIDKSAISAIPRALFPSIFFKTFSHFHYTESVSSQCTHIHCLFLSHLSQDSTSPEGIFSSRLTPFFLPFPFPLYLSPSLLGLLNVIWVESYL